VTRLGATKNYAQNWGLAFGQKSAAKPGSKAKAAAPKKGVKKPAKTKGK